MNIQQRLEEKLIEYKSLERAKSHLKKLEQRMHTMKQKIEKLQIILEKEYRDVEQLEKLSLRNIFEKILGDKEIRIEKEKQEYLNAALNYNQQKKSLELLEFEKEVLVKKLSNFDRTKSEMFNLIRQREQSLIIEDPVAKQVLRDINKSIDENFLQSRALHETIIQGEKVGELLQAITKDLEKVTAWGPYQLNAPDQNIQKKFYVDKAREKISRANQLLQQFQDEIEELYKGQKFSLHASLNSFEHFIQSFFDNLISDWIILMKIENALQTVQQVNDNVTRIVRSLKDELEINKQKTINLRTKKEQIILELN